MNYDLIKGFPNIIRIEGLFLSYIMSGYILFQSSNQTYHIMAPCLLCLRTPFQVEIVNKYNLEVKSLVVPFDIENIKILSSLIYEINSNIKKYGNVLTLADFNKKRFEYLFSLMKSETIQLNYLSDFLCEIELLYKEQNTCLPSNSGLVEKTIAYLNENYHQKITLNELCKKLNTNRTSLSEGFKEKTGTTIFQYLINYRIEQAKTYLTYSTLRITEIAYRCGFHYESYFNKIFTQVVGITPLRYRGQYYQK